MANVDKEGEKELLQKNALEWTENNGERSAWLLSYVYHKY